MYVCIQITYIRKFFKFSPKNPSFRNSMNLRKILPSTFIYEPFLISIYMNANIVKT